MIAKKIIDKVYDKIFRARNEIEEDKFWKEFYRTKLNLYKKRRITDLEDWIEMRYYNKLKDFIKELLNLRTFHQLKILELGSGSGLLSLLMAKEGAFVVLVDKLKEACIYSSILFRKLKKSTFKGKVKIINKDMFSLKLSANFDIVHNYGVIEHFSYNKAIKIIKTMKKYSKKGGTVIVGVPNYLSPDTIFLWSKYRKGTEKYYSKSELKKLLEESGLNNIKVITSTSVFPYFFPRWLLRKVEKIENFLGKKVGLGFLHVGIGKNE